MGVRLLPYGHSFIFFNIAGFVLLQDEVIAFSPKTTNISLEMYSTRPGFYTLRRDHVWVHCSVCLCVSRMCMINPTVEEKCGVNEVCMFKQLCMSRYKESKAWKGPLRP